MHSVYRAQEVSSAIIVKSDVEAGQRELFEFIFNVDLLICQRSGNYSPVSNLRLFLGRKSFDFDYYWINSMTQCRIIVKTLCTRIKLFIWFRKNCEMKKYLSLFRFSNYTDALIQLLVFQKTENRKVVSKGI